MYNVCKFKARKICAQQIFSNQIFVNCNNDCNNPSFKPVIFDPSINSSSTGLVLDDYVLSLNPNATDNCDKYIWKQYNNDSTMGATGEQGATGVGEQGATGEYGIGEQGATGEPGIDGRDGEQGATGEYGIGEQGATGEPGIDGRDGEQGATGEYGIGEQGATGDPGLDGEQGATGDPGQSVVLSTNVQNSSGSFLGAIMGPQAPAYVGGVFGINKGNQVQLLPPIGGFNYAIMVFNAGSSIGGGWGLVNVTNTLQPTFIYPGLNGTFLTNTITGETVAAPNSPIQGKYAGSMVDNINYFFCFNNTGHIQVIRIDTSTPATPFIQLVAQIQPVATQGGAIDIVFNKTSIFNNYFTIYYPCQNGIYYEYEFYGAVFTATIPTTTSLVVTGVASGSIYIGMTLIINVSVTGVFTTTTITGYTSGVTYGGAGTYSITTVAATLVNLTSQIYNATYIGLQGTITTASASFQGYIGTGVLANNILTVTSMTSGIISVGMSISSSGGGPFSFVAITGYLTGGGGVGTYTVSTVLNVGFPAEPITGTLSSASSFQGYIGTGGLTPTLSNILTVTTMTSGIILIGTVLSGTGIGLSNAVVTGYLSVTNGVGTYTISTNLSVGFPAQTITGSSSTSPALFGVRNISNGNTFISNGGGYSLNSIDTGTNSASFTATVTTNALTVVLGSITGTIAIGQTIAGPGIPSGTTITGGAGLNWTLSASVAPLVINNANPFTTLSISSINGVYLNPIFSFNGYIDGLNLTITSVNSGSITQGSLITSPGIIANTVINTLSPNPALGAATGTVNFPQTIGTSISPVTFTNQPYQPQAIIYSSLVPDYVYLLSYLGIQAWIIDITSSKPIIVNTSIKCPGGSIFGGNGQNILATIKQVSGQPWLYIGNNIGFYDIYSLISPSTPLFLYNINTQQLTNGFASYINPLAQPQQQILNGYSPTTNFFDVDTNGNIYVINRSQNTTPFDGNILEIFSYLASAGAQISVSPTTINSVMVSGIFSNYNINYIPMGQTLSFTFSNIFGNLPSSEGETTSNVVALTTQNPIIFPLIFNGISWYNSVWPLSATVSTFSTNPTAVDIIIKYTNNTGLPQNIPNNFSVAFIVAYP